jgi:hypothetical protein
MPPDRKNFFLNCSYSKKLNLNYIQKDKMRDAVDFLLAFLKAVTDDFVPPRRDRTYNLV